MKGVTFATTVSALLGAAAANSHAHEQKHNAHEALFERALAAVDSVAATNATQDCGCTTQVVTYFGEPMLVPDATSTTTLLSTTYTTVTVQVSSAASQTSNAGVAESSTTSEVVVPGYTSTSSEAAPAYTSSVETSAAAATSTFVASSSIEVAPTSVYSSAAASSTGSSGFSTNGNQWAMTYSPYTDDSQCKDSGTMTTDIASIKAKGFTSVRIYSTDCEGLSVIGDAARSNGLKMILGVYISETGTADAQEQVDAITSWAQWDLVELISVGNEALFNEWVSASALASFIGSSKSSFQTAGYTGPVTTTETVGIWQSEGSALCDVVDVLGANIHPFFGAVSPDQSGSFINEQFSMVEAVCSGKTAYNLEVGWPTAGQCNGAACPGFAEQATALAVILPAAGTKSAFFSFQNELWKPAGEFDVEQSWGCGNFFSG